MCYKLPRSLFPPGIFKLLHVIVEEKRAKFFFEPKRRKPYLSYILTAPKPIQCELSHVKNKAEKPVFLPSFVIQVASMVKLNIYFTV
ncbi:hypothetical protein FN924_03415 [Radiobacillus deserti]|uniref:Uncharacterized protein n=1 Tax=Radiobacillus deserti TaxID=2594883 RepID=A0A516KD28_9BACI|nr:hypothetical protein FN924_03415 [Radiobacillus deserti]